MEFVKVTCDGQPTYISIDAIVIIESIIRYSATEPEGKKIGSRVTINTEKDSCMYHVDQDPDEVIRRINLARERVKKHDHTKTANARYRAAIQRIREYNQELGY